MTTDALTALLLETLETLIIFGTLNWKPWHSIFQRTTILEMHTILRTDILGDAHAAHHRDQVKTIKKLSSCCSNQLLIRIFQLACKLSASFLLLLLPLLFLVFLTLMFAAFILL